MIVCDEKKNGKKRPTAAKAGEWATDAVRRWAELRPTRPPRRATAVRAANDRAGTSLTLFYSLTC